MVPADSTQPGLAVFSPADIRRVLALPIEQLRNWRRHLPSIGQDRSGQALFDFADLLALAIVQRLVAGLGVRIGMIEPIAPQLVEACRCVNLEEAAAVRMEFDLEGKRMMLRPIEALPAEALMILLPLGPTVKMLLARLTIPPTEPDTLPLFRQ